MIRRVGVLSDTHGRASIARQAVTLLMDRRVDALVHCGDIGTGEEGRAVLDALVEAVPCWFVWGNTDWDSVELEPYAASLGLHALGDGGFFDAEGCRIAVQHGHLETLYASLRDSGENRYLMSGHSHVPHDERVAGCRLLNPGALFRTRQPTVGVLDVAADDWDLLTVGR